MDRNQKRTFHLAVISMLVLSLNGCTKYACRLYPGPPLNKEEIVLVYAVGDTAIYDIRDAKETNLEGLKRINLKKWVELLPGEYVAGIRYTLVSGGWEYRGPRVQISLPVKAGNTYVIYPEISGNQSNLTWQPVFVNINDYSKTICIKSDRKDTDIAHDCPDKEEIRKWATEYLQSDRLSMRYHKYKTPLILKSTIYNYDYIIDGDWEE